MSFFSKSVILPKLICLFRAYFVVSNLKTYTIGTGGVFQHFHFQFILPCGQILKYLASF